MKNVNPLLTFLYKCYIIDEEGGIEAMDINPVVTIISQFGFPIAVALVLMWYIYKMNQEQKEERKAHKEEIDKLSKAVNNNTLVMQKLIDRLEVKGNE